MSEYLFLLDWENNCQSFLKGYQQPPDGSPLAGRLKVILFVRKSNEDLRENELPSYVEVRRAPTDTKDAADTILKQYVATDILDDRPRSSGFWSSSSSNRRIFLVHGGDKGYATVVAQLQERIGDKYQYVNGANTCLADTPDIKYTTGGECDHHILFASDSDRSSHLRSSSCCCGAKFRCVEAPRHKAWRCPHITGFEFLPPLKCFFQCCEKQEDLKLAHLDKEHPRCTHPGCPCGNVRFPHPGLLKVHTDRLNAHNAVNRCHRFDPACLMINYGVLWRISPDVGTRRWFIRHTVSRHPETCQKCPICKTLLVDSRHCQSHFDREHKDVRAKDRPK
eukprot:CAMPEP_0174232672 /NCGR_PEP_ID=MMETSP0417-20130205/2894_1 /TAXON_ID=242541 /ORGANISM="Mayorella sp, Strain BSH-02190019" /LENGTH=335 /DNA_ID=CAMNT_0015310759 /DNA_START=42 /DNA_END=1046 /DNA_ORIENTATION=-